MDRSDCRYVSCMIDSVVSQATRVIAEGELLGVVWVSF